MSELTSESQPFSPRAIAILGMHRSGTSALSRVLNLMGVELGSNMMIASADNERGYWEHEEINTIHVVLLKALGRLWSDFGDLPEDWLHSPQISQPVEQLQKVIEREFAGKPLWGVKDPRMCLLVPLWLDVFRRAGVDPGFVIIVRNPLEITRSIFRRDGISEARGLMIWLRYILAAERDSRGQKRVFVGYQQLLNDPKGVVDRIGQALNIAWPHSYEAAGPEIKKFLEPSLRRHQVDDEAFLADLAVPEIVRRAYALFSAATAGQTEGLPVQLDAIRAELTPVALLLTQAIEGVELDNRRLVELLDQQRVAAEHHQAVLRVQLQSANESVKALEEKTLRLQQLEAENWRISTSWREMQAHVDAARTHNQQLEAENLRLTSAFQEMQAHVDAAKTHNQQLETENLRLSSASEEMEARVDAAKTHNQQLEAENFRVGALVADTQAQLEAARNELRATAEQSRVELAGAHELAAARELQLSDLRRRHQELGERMDELRGREERASAVARERAEELERQRTQFQGKIHALRQENSAAREAIENERRATGILRRENHQLRRSLSWRMTGGIRLLGRWMKRLRFTAEDLVPSHDLEPVGAGSWSATGSDPQFILPCGPGIRWARIEIQFFAAVRSRSELYFDVGSGFTPDQRLDLGEQQGAAVISLLHRLPRGTRAIRWDPISVPGTFRVDRFLIAEVPALSVLFRSRLSSLPGTAAPPPQSPSPQF